MRRREFIAGLGGAAAWPVAGWAQQSAMPVIGYLSFGSPGEGVGSVTAFLQGLAAAGYVEGRDVAVEFRWAYHQGRQLLSLATELVQRQVAMIVALDGGPSALAAQSATSTIPILFLLGADPAKFGFVAGGNMTGLTAVSSELMGKRLDLLREMNPLATTVAYLIDPRAQDSEEPTRAMVGAGARARTASRDPGSTQRVRHRCGLRDPRRARRRRARLRPSRPLPEECQKDHRLDGEPQNIGDLS
jgi:putative tryptophan/tyrosine transport system substrate-binding protein